jgi:hypothetical protein
MEILLPLRGIHLGPKRLRVGPEFTSRTWLTPLHSWSPKMKASDHTSTLSWHPYCNR